MKRKLFCTLFVAVIALVGSGCQPQQSETSTPATETLVKYLTALTSKDEVTLTLLSCAEWEASALLELDAFQSVETNLEGLSCRQTADGDGTATVICEGKIVAGYFDEVQEFDLNQRTYSMVQLGGDWLVCGY